MTLRLIRNFNRSMRLTKCLAIQKKERNTISLARIGNMQMPMNKRGSNKDLKAMLADLLGDSDIRVVKVLTIVTSPTFLNLCSAVEVDLAVVAKGAAPNLKAKMSL